jgi:hypothetical protein
MSQTTLVVTSVTTPGVSVVVDKIGSDYWPITEIVWGPYGTPVPVDTGTPLPTQFRNASGTAIGVSTAPIVVAPASSGVAFSVAQSGAFVVTVGQMPAVSIASGASVAVSQIGVWAVSLAQGTNVGVSVVNLGTQVSLASGVANIGQVGLAPQTSGGLSVYSIITSASTNAVLIKSGVGQFFGYAFFNNTATPRYAKIYDVSITPAATDTPKFRVIIPGASAGSGANLEIVNGAAFNLGIGLRVTTCVADNDTGATTQNDVVANVFYK